MVRTVPLASDAGLVPAAIAGDEAAFDALVGPLVEPGFKLAMVMLRDSGEAQDAVQEACIMAWRKLSYRARYSTYARWFRSSSGIESPPNFSRNASASVSATTASPMTPAAGTTHTSLRS
jgi:hypothetical protein